MKWLKSFFKKTGIEEYNINSAELFEWFMEKTEPIVSEYKEKAIDDFGEISRARDLLKEKLVLLAEARLQNEKIPEKVRTIMNGNRESYIKFIRIFADSLEIPKEPGYEKITKFVSSFEEKINLLNKNSARNYYVLQEFFSNETKEIAEQLKKIDLLVRGLLDKKISDIGKIKKKLNELETAFEQKKKKASSINEEKVSVLLIEKTIGAAIIQLEALKKSKQYAELENLTRQKAMLQNKILNNEKVLANAFSIISKPIRKYTYLYPEEKQLFESYLGDPLNSLLSDTNLLIVEGLVRLRTSILTNVIDVKDKEKDRAMMKLNELSRERLQIIKEAYQKLKTQVSDVEKRIRLNNVQREIEELEYRLKHLREKHIKMKAEFEKKEKKEDRKDISAHTRELEDDINSLLDTHINIILPVQEGEEHGEYEEDSETETGGEGEDSEDEENDKHSNEYKTEKNKKGKKEADYESDGPDESEDEFEYTEEIREEKD